MPNTHPGMSVMPTVWRPQEIGEAYRMKQSLGETAVYAAGGTLLRTQWEAGTAVLPAHLIDLSAVPMLAGYALEPSELVIGACCPLAALRKDPLVQTAFPLLAEAVRNIAAPSIRNLATLGGNVVSRIGDSLPALLADEAELIWLGKNGMQAEPLEDWLAASGSEQAGRVLVQIRVQHGTESVNGAGTMNDIRSAPLLKVDSDRSASVRIYHKVGRREAFTPSVGSLAISAGMEHAAGKLKEVRIAAGGGQTIPKRLERTERLLERHADPLGEDCAAEVHRSAMDEFEPVGDLFASRGYRKMTVANLLVAELWRLRERFA
ncbi:FAD binding domain-containing protein [Paenibacillus methanolicus]|uniref:Carbon-monoxide dehydrogenase medium subunit n=1 Tax=Paenibacillus methanolicus TaxID=582686 RepID=A0A5S5CIH8_9BACL|nr:FAD binding domain-containing protein [Paenibacillus methanolicus]TYP79589.1 carbon-monoxide dehydrogenase medium subunit [Paenibacillus methanolicus]